MDLIRRLPSLTFCLIISIWAVEGKYNSLQLLFGLLVYAAFLYEHGYKLDYMKGKKKLFFVYYVVPFGVAACGVALQLLS